MEFGARHPCPSGELALREPFAVAGGHEVGAWTWRTLRALQKPRKVGTLGGRGVVGVEHEWKPLDARSRRV